MKTHTVISGPHIDLVNSRSPALAPREDHSAGLLEEAALRPKVSQVGPECSHQWGPGAGRYLVVVFHVLQVALLADEQVQILLPVCMHGLHVSLPGEGGAGHCWQVPGTPKA